MSEAYGGERKFPNGNDSKVEKELVSVFREMRKAVHEDGGTVNRMVIEIAQNEFFTGIGWRAYEKRA